MMSKNSYIDIIWALEGFRDIINAYRDIQKLTGIWGTFMKIQSTFRAMFIQSFLKCGEF